MTWQRIKWAFTALVAMTMTVLAWIYGKRTVSVARWVRRADAAKERALAVAVVTQKRKALEVESQRKAAEHAARAAEIERRLHEHRQRAQARASDRSGVVLYMSDDELAIRDNLRVRARAQRG